MAQGAVKWFNESKGYGYIISDEGERELFVHHTEIHGYRFPQLRPGQRVDFQVENQPRGPKAVKVRPL